jgi:hypothetical protein
MASSNIPAERTVLVIPNHPQSNIDDTNDACDQGLSLEKILSLAVGILHESHAQGNWD